MHINLPIAAIAFLLGVCGTLFFVPGLPIVWVLLILAIGSLVFTRKHIVSVVAILLLGFCYMSYNILYYQQHSFPAELEGVPITVTGTIASVVEDIGSKKSEFLFDISSPADLMGKVKISWYSAPKSLRPGDRWQLTVKLKRPRGYANPGSFDAERYYFMQRIPAIGYVVTKKSKNTLLGSSTTIDTIRHSIRSTINNHGEFAGIISALTLGLKNGISAEQKSVLSSTGTAHLMAISGLHIGLVASIVFFLVKLAWRIVPMRWQRFPAPWIAALAALFTSAGYAFLAGFSIATQRALIMVLCMLGGLIFRRSMSAVNAFFLSMILVLLWDPFVILGVGFWLSFWAVGCLLYAFTGRAQLSRPWRWLKPQLVIMLGLLPLSLLFFHQSSLVAPIANLIAIPWVGFLVVPFCLLGLWGIAEYSLQMLWPFLEYLHTFPVYEWVPAGQYLGLRLLIAVVGFIWLFAPRGFPSRWWGLCCFLPLFIFNIPSVPYGQARFDLLDVGQGLSAVVRTSKHTLVYDLGNPGLGKMVVAPFLRNYGIRQIDLLMISHADRDHVGGLESLLDTMLVNAFTSSAVNPMLEGTLCAAGQSWEWDGVQFDVLHPSKDFVSKKKNDQSCVLMVQAGEHKVLLTGDIEKKSERNLILTQSEQLSADVMLIPHHGSRTSSSVEFLDAVRPSLALIPVGHRNPYGHPKEQVLERYWDRGIEIYRTDSDGAISLVLGKDLQPKLYRKHGIKGFWSTN